jgi:hypothetical protein
MKPSVGRIVHYVSYGTPGGECTSQCRAAIITEVTEVESWDDDNPRYLLGLAVMNPTGMFFNQGVHQDESGKRGGTWHWPERVE